jgi:HPt (histidine-containing phosphotransfer) domain-containing protein
MASYSTPSSVLDVCRLEELRELLGPEKLNEALRAFEQHLYDARCAVEATEPADPRVLILAHQMSSAAGSLGFEELARASRTVMTCAPGKPREADFPTALAALQVAVQQAASALSSVPR